MLSFSGLSLQPGSRVFTDIIVLFEGPSGVYFLSGFELCCLFSEPLSALCFCLLSPGSHQFLTSWANDDLTRDAHTPTFPLSNSKRVVFVVIN